MTIKFLVELFPYLKKKEAEPESTIPARKRRVARLERAVDRLREPTEKAKPRNRAKAQARLWRVLKRLEALEG